MYIYTCIYSSRYFVFFSSFLVRLTFQVARHYGLTPYIYILYIYIYINTYMYIDR